MKDKELYLLLSNILKTNEKIMAQLTEFKQTNEKIQTLEKEFNELNKSMVIFRTQFEEFVKKIESYDLMGMTEKINFLDARSSIMGLIGGALAFIIAVVSGKL